MSSSPNVLKGLYRGLYRVGAYVGEYYIGLTKVDTKRLDSSSYIYIYIYRYISGRTSQTSIFTVTLQYPTPCSSIRLGASGARCPEDAGGRNTLPRSRNPKPSTRNSAPSTFRYLGVGRV